MATDRLITIVISTVDKFRTSQVQYNLHQEGGANFRFAEGAPFREDAVTLSVTASTRCRDERMQSGLLMDPYMHCN